MAENRYNDPPHAEFQFFMVTIQARNVGQQRSYFYESELQVVGEAVGVVYTTFQDSCGVIPDQFIGEVMPTFEIETNVCWHIASKDLETLMMFSEGGLRGNDVWFSLR